MKDNPTQGGDELLDGHFTFWDDDDETYVNAGWLTKPSKEKLLAWRDKHTAEAVKEAGRKGDKPKTSRHNSILKHP